MWHCPPAVVFAWINDELHGNTSAAQGQAKLLGILDGYVPVLFAADEQRGGRGILNVVEG